MKRELKMDYDEFLNIDFLKDYMGDKDLIRRMGKTMESVLSGKYYEVRLSFYDLLAKDGLCRAIGFLLLQDIKYISTVFDNNTLLKVSMVFDGFEDLSNSKDIDDGYKLVKMILNSSFHPTNKILQSNIGSLLNGKILEDKNLLTKIGKEVSELGLEFAFIKAMIFYGCVFNKFHGFNSLFEDPDSSDIEHLEELFRRYYTDNEINTHVEKFYAVIKGK